MKRVDEQDTKYLRICHVQVLPILSGVQNTMLDIFRNVVPGRYRFSLICSMEGPLTEECREMGVRTVIVGNLVREINPVRDLVALVNLWRHFRKERYDIVHTHSSKPGFLGRIAARLAGIPLVVHTVHGFAFGPQSGWFPVLVYSLLEKLAGFFCDTVIFVSREDRDDAIGRGLVPAAKTEVIYNGADPAPLLDEAERNQLRQELGIPDGYGCVLFCGRLWKQKNPLAVIHTADEYKRCCNGKAVFLVAGDGPFEEELRTEIRQRNLPEIRLLGWRNDVPRLLRLADIVFLPSLWEGLPLSLIEAVVCGKPVVASDIKGNREVVESGVTGFLREEDDYRGFAADIGKLLTDERLYGQMSGAALSRAVKLFDLKKNTAGVEAIYTGRTGV